MLCSIVVLGNVVLILNQWSGRERGKKRKKKKLPHVSLTNVGDGKHKQTLWDHILPSNKWLSIHTHTFNIYFLYFIFVFFWLI